MRFSICNDNYAIKARLFSEKVPCKEYKEQTTESGKECFVETKPGKKISVEYSWKGKVDELLIDLVIDGVPRNCYQIYNLANGLGSRKFTYALFHENSWRSRPIIPVHCRQPVSKKLVEGGESQVGLIELRVSIVSPELTQNSLATYNLKGLEGASRHNPVTNSQGALDETEPLYHDIIAPNLVFS